MEKTATLNLRVNPIAKQRAEQVLKQLGIPMSTAMDMYLNQIALVGGIPFPVTLPKAPSSVNADMMSDEELVSRLNRGIADADAELRTTDLIRRKRQHPLKTACYKGLCGQGGAFRLMCGAGKRAGMRIGPYTMDTITL